MCIKYSGLKSFIEFQFLVMMKSKEVIAVDSENEFEVDEPEDVGDHSDDDWNPNAAVCYINISFKKIDSKFIYLLG